MKREMLRVTEGQGVRKYGSDGSGLGERYHGSISLVVAVMGACLVAPISLTMRGNVMKPAARKCPSHLQGPDRVLRVETHYIQENLFRGTRRSSEIRCSGKTRESV